MDLQQLARDLRTVADAIDNRVDIYIQVVDVNGTFGGKPAERHYVGSFQATPDSHVGERRIQENRT